MGLILDVGHRVFHDFSIFFVGKIGNSGLIFSLANFQQRHFAIPPDKVINTIILYYFSRVIRGCIPPENHFYFQRIFPCIFFYDVAYINNSCDVQELLHTDAHDSRLNLFQHLFDTRFQRRKIFCIIIKPA